MTDGKHQPLVALNITTSASASPDGREIILQVYSLSDLGDVVVAGKSPREATKLMKRALEKRAGEVLGGTWVAVPLVNDLTLQRFPLAPFFALLPWDALMQADHQGLAWIKDADED